MTEPTTQSERFQQVESNTHEEASRRGSGPPRAKPASAASSTVLATMAAIISSTKDRVETARPRGLTEEGKDSWDEITLGKERQEKDSMKKGKEGRDEQV